MKRKIYIILGVTTFILISAELLLRSYFGFCDTVLMEEDPDYEYIAQPNQYRFRFRNNIYYNKESMRNNEIDNTAVKVLVFGDSVINGGSLTDQDSLATTILSDTLSKYYNKKIQFLNISAGSWGPDNCYAYLQKHGDFNARHIFLFVNSHDAYDNMNFEKIVGVNESFPDQQYRSALYELFDRYLLPRLSVEFNWSSGKTNDLGINKKHDGSVFNSGFESFLLYSRSHNMSFTIYLHADIAELKAGVYNEQGQDIIRFSETNNIPIIKDIETGLEISDFRDNIHLNEKGQKKISTIVLSFILEHLQTQI